MLAGSDRVLFGAAYYHEYQPYDRLDVDLDLMQEAHFCLDRRSGRRRNQAPIPAQLVLGSRLSIRAHRGARHSDWGNVPHPRSRPTRALGCSGACSETTVTADGRAAAVGVGTVRERDWLFDGHARIGEALDD